MGVNLGFECIVLSCRPFFESDRLLTIFSQNQGKIRVLASKANSKSSRFSGLLDTGHVLNVSIRSGKTFSYLEQCRLTHEFPNIRKSYNRISMMHHFFELVMKSTPYEQPNSEVFELLSQGLHLLNSEVEIASIQQHFYTQFLIAEGLLTPNANLVSTSTFVEAYQTYSGHPVVLPSLIHDD